MWPSSALAHAPIVTIAALIITCPCASALATPISIMAASGRGARASVPFRGTAAVEALRQVDTLVVDKTSPRTTNRVTLTELAPPPGSDTPEAPRLAVDGRLAALLAANRMPPRLSARTNAPDGKPSWPYRRCTGHGAGRGLPATA